MGKVQLIRAMALAVALVGVRTAEARHAKQVERPPAVRVAPDPIPLAPLDLSAFPSPAPIRAVVDDLIFRAQAAYNAGVAEYRADQLELAKQEFDRSISLLLGSKLDIQSNERLNAEFDTLVENIYGMELAAVERGDALATHTYEPPPIESFSGLTFPVDPNVRQHAERELQVVRSDLPLVSNDYVAGVLTYLQDHARKYIATILERKGTYQQVISEALRKEGLPQDLIYLAAAESSFNPFALSRKGAKGIWQFMPGTARLYGLKVNRWVDEREDPYKSTQAAARNLKSLYDTFGDWFLAMAAYDWSPAAVERAIQRTGYADYWTLRKLHTLPAETQNYVPIFLATALIAKDPKAYGFNVSSNPPLEADAVRMSAPTDLRLIAELIGHPVSELIRLNPGLLRWTTPADDPGFMLYLPAGAAKLYQERITEVPLNRRMWWRAYRVDGSATLASVARKFRFSEATLAAVNHLDASSPLAAGREVLLPFGPGRYSTLARTQVVRRRRLYRVRPGDTITLVARRFHATPYEVRRWNHLGSSHLVAGRLLLVYAPARPALFPGRYRKSRAAKPTRRRSRIALASARSRSRKLTVRRISRRFKTRKDVALATSLPGSSR